MTAAPQSFEVIPLGTGNSFCRSRFHTSLLLAADEGLVLVDCPEPFFRMCHEAEQKSGRRVDPASILDIVLTHLHSDHCSGLESLGFWRRFAANGTAPPRIHTVRAVGSALWDRLAPAMAEAMIYPGGIRETYTLEDYYTLHQYEFGETFEAGGIKIETRQTQHFIPTFGFRATYAGRRFGYSCDTLFDREHIRFLEPCDLIFHECDVGRMHTRLEELEALPAPLRAKIRLIHLSDDFVGSSKLEAAEPGRVYRV